MPRILICVPTYNERANVAPLVEEIMGVCQKHKIPAKILFIDDQSPDGTGDEIRRVEKLYTDFVSAIHRQGKGGLASAYIAGFKWALDPLNGEYDYVMEMDCDFSHEPRSLADFHRTMSDQAPDAIVGSRYTLGGGVANWSEWRYLLSRLGSLYSTVWLRYQVGDWTGGFNAWTLRTLRLLDLESIGTRGYAFQIELKLRTLARDLNLVEIPIQFQDRRWGESKMGGSIVFEALKAVIELRLKLDQGRLFSKKEFGVL